MYRIKRGDIVGRKSYKKDILFTVEKIIKKANGKQVAILKGIILRIEADADLDDLVLIEKQQVERNMRSLENKIEEKIKRCAKRRTNNVIQQRKFLGRSIDEENGKILHLDGDKKYSDKSMRYYKKIGLNAIVRNVPENRQEYVVMDLLNRYNPDILVITGHDGMIKNGTGYNDIYNYRNSKYFINTVREAKKWVNRTGKDLVIFAGACQSYYEALVAAGANFASSPARVLIDFMDPLVVAEKVATTEDYKYITINDIADELRDGTKGINGIGARGKRTTNKREEL